MQKNQRKNQQTNEQEKEIRRNGGNREETESSSRSWKEIVDEKLQRLHSLQFGAEEALENGDGETSLMLNLCLLGFLEIHKSISASLIHIEKPSFPKYNCNCKVKYCNIWVSFLWFQANRTLGKTE